MKKDTGSCLHYSKKWKYMTLSWEQGFCNQWFYNNIKDVKNRMKHCKVEAYEIKRRIK